MYNIIEQLVALLKQQLNNNQFLTGGLLLGTLTSILYPLRTIPGEIWQRIKRKIVFNVSIEQDDDLYPWFQNFLNTHYTSQLRNVKALYYSYDNDDSTQPISYDGKRYNVKSKQLVFNHYGDTFVIWFKGRLLSISNSKDKMENASSFRSLFFEKYHISGLMAEKAIKSLLTEVIEFNEKESAEKVKCNLYELSYDQWEVSKGTTFRDMDKVFINKEIKQSIINDLKTFINNKDFYQKRGIPYRRGYLLDGPPGTGKSSLASAIANYLKRDLYTLSLKNLDSGQNFERALSRVKKNSILIIEDIDTYFNDRHKDTKISFSTFINAFSGVKSKEDMILIITTNHKEVLDNALMRAGRLDMHFCISYATLDQVNDYLSWFYEMPIKMSYVKETMTIADVENICIQNKFDHNKAVADIYLRAEVEA